MFSPTYHTIFCKEMLLSLISKFKESFVRESQTYDETEADELFLNILTEVHKGVSQGDVDSLKCYSSLIEWMKDGKSKDTLINYFDKVSNSVKNSCFIITACKYNQLGIIKHMFGDETNVLRNLSIHLVRESVSPSAVDNECHNCFYYAIRSNNLNLIDTLVNKWPGDYFVNHSEELDDILSKAYKELMIKNVPLSDEMKIFVQDKLIGLRFFSDDSEKSEYVKITLPNLKLRIDLITTHVKILRDEYSVNSQVDGKFLSTIKFIASNIHILKRKLKSTYNKVPWEEMEFCLVSFVSYHIKKQEINVYFRSVLNKEKILSHLKWFSECLPDVMGEIDNGDFKILQKPVTLPRKNVIESIVSIYPAFRELYNDFDQIRDVYSLEKMGTYIKLAVSADCANKEGQLIVTRALQIIGEHLKNTLESPKLSSAMSELLLYSVPPITRKIITNLRDLLSHSESLGLRIEIEEETDGKFFKKIQNDIKRIGCEINTVLYKNKMKITRTILRNFIDNDELGKVIEMIESIPSLDFHNSGELSKVDSIEELIEKLRALINEKTFYEVELFKKIDKIIISEKNKLSSIKSVYPIGLESLSFLCHDFDINMAVKCNTLSLLKNHAKMVSNNLESIASAIDLNRSSELVVLCHKVLDSAKLRMNSEKIDELNYLCVKIFHTLKVEMQNITWIEDFGEKLLTNKKEFLKNKQTKQYVINKNEDKYTALLEQKLSQLKTIFKSNDENGQMAEKKYSVLSNEELQAAAEMILLDIMSILESSKKCLSYNLLYLDRNFPLLIGRCLRDHLAHCNALMEVLYFDPAIVIISNSRKLIIENILVKNKKIGKLVKDNPLNAEKNLNEELEVIANQERMFEVIKEGNYAELMICIKNGADIWARNNNLWTSLHFAAMSTSLEVIKFILDNNFNANVRDQEGKSPLHIAASFGRENIVEFFISEIKMDVNERDNFSRTPLHYASQNGDEDVVKLLLKHKAGTNSKDISGYSPVHYAVHNNHTKVAITLLKKEKNVDANQIIGGYTSLCIAAEFGLTELVNYLLKNKADPNTCNDKQGIPLHSAALNSHLDVVKALISNDANVNAKIFNGCTPLHCAVVRGHKEIVKILLTHGANVNIADKKYHNTPLHHAAKGGSEEIVKDLLSYDANAYAETREGLTPLIFAAMYGHEEIVVLLLKHNDLVNFADKSGQTALHAASYSGKKYILSLLLKGGANLNAIDKKKRNSLHFASSGGCKEVVDFLISKGVNVNDKDENDQTPLHLSALGGHKDISEVLINSGVCIDEKNGSERTPLHLAVCIKNNTCTIEYLLSKGANVDAKDFIGVTVLGLAVISGNLDAVRLLLEAGANVNLLCMDVTPLYLAVMGNHKDLVNILISKGADLNTKDQFGFTPLGLAIDHNNEDIAQILISGADINVGEVLHMAVLKGSKRILNMLLNHNSIKMDIKSHDTGESNLLHLAAMRGIADIAKALLSKGLDVDVKGEGNVTPLYLAVDLGHKEASEVFLKNGANVNHETIHGTPLFNAASRGYNDVLKVLLQYGGDVNILDSKKRTPIEIAVAKNHLEVVETLLSHEATNIHMKGNENYSLLHIAAQEGNLEIVRLLVDKGVDVHSKNDKGSKPIHIAARGGHKDIVEFFLSKGNNVNDRDASLCTLLHYAAFGGHVEVGQFLVELNVDIDAVDEHNRNPIHTASLEGNIEFLLYLLSKGGVYNAEDIFELKPVDLATNPDLKKILVSTDKLFVAVKENNLSGVETCLREGAFIDAKSEDNSMVLHHAACKGYEKVVDILPKNKANPNVIAKNGYTPLHYASKFGHFDIAKALLSNGAKYNVSSVNGKTPLQFANNIDIINLLELVDNSFQGVQNGNPNVVKDLNKVKDVDKVKAVMKCCNWDGMSLTVTAIHNDYPNLKRLNEILQDDVSHQIRLANLSSSDERFEKSSMLLMSALKKREDILGANNPGTFDIQIELAKTLYLQNKYKDALCNFQEIYEKQKSVFGAENKGTLRTRSFIGLSLNCLGRDEEALNIYEEVYPIQKKILGECDSETLDTLFYMAVSLNSVGRYEEALKYNRYVFKKRKSTLGPGHPYTLEAQNYIANSLYNMDKTEEALNIYKEVYEGRKRVLGLNHSVTIRTLHHIAMVFFKQQRLDDSLKALEEVYDLQKEVLGENHIDTLKTQLNIGNVLFRQGKFIGALKTYKDGLEQRKVMLGSNHPEILDTIAKIEIAISHLQSQGISGSEALKLMQNNIHVAANNGDEKVVEGLIKNGMNPNARDNEGTTPLHFAVYGNHKEVAVVLLRNGANFMIVTKKGNSVLHTAISKGYKEMVYLLLQHVKLNDAGKLYDFVNAKTIVSGSTVLHIAAKNGRLDIVKLVLEYGATYDAVDIIGKKTPLDYSKDQDIIVLLKLIGEMFNCACNGNLNIISKLERLKSDEFSAVLNARNCKGKTALQIASISKHKDIAQLLIKMSRENRMF